MDNRIEVVTITWEIQHYYIMAALEKLGLADKDVTRDEIVQIILDDARKPNHRFDNLSAFEYQTLLGHFGIDMDWILMQRQRLVRERDSISGIIDACTKSAAEVIRNGLELKRNRPLARN